MPMWGCRRPSAPVVSNIHQNGTAAVEAGAYVAEVIAKILEQKASGVDLVK